MEGNKEKKLENVDSNQVLADVVYKSIKEAQTKKWMMFFVYILGFSYLILSMLGAMKFMEKIPNVDGFNNDHLALISMKGEVGAGKGIDAHEQVTLLEKAFHDPKTKKIVLDLNSPGGSPTHAKIIYDRILDLKKETGKKIVSSVEDGCASACYYIASATDEIYVTPVSIIGSIGVKLDSWDLTGLMDKLGIKNDTLHSGRNKLLIDPFHKKDPVIVSYLEDEVLKDLHNHFIDDVKKGRPVLAKLPNSADEFSGLIYSGSKAIHNGFADGIGDIYTILSQSRKESRDPNLVYIKMSPNKSLIQKLLANASSTLINELH